MNEKNFIGYYAVIPSPVLFNENLKPNEKLLYAVITVLANKEGYCFASNNYLAELFNSKAHTISNWISHLSKLNFVHVELIKNENNEIIQRRIYINDIPYVINMTYPYSTKKTESMSQKGQYNNDIDNKIDRFFNYIIKREYKDSDYFNEFEEVEFWKILKNIGFDYNNEVIKIFTKENIEKIKIILFSLKELYMSSKRQLIYKVTKENLIFLYDKCKSKQEEYEGTIKQINNFFEYYFTSLIKSLEKNCY